MLQLLPDQNVISLDITKTKYILLKLVAITALFVLLLPYFVVRPAPVRALSEIEQIDQEINNIESTIQSNLQKKQTAENEIATIDSQVQIIRLQMNSTKLQIDEATNKILALNAQITESENNLKTQKTLLGEFIRQMYIDGQVSNVQLVLTSKNFSEFVDRSQYLNTLQDKVTETISSIQLLKDGLDKKKIDVEVVKSTAESLMTSQTLQKGALDSQQAYKNSVIAGINSSNQDLLQDKQELYIKKALLSASFGETIGSGSTGYPWGNPSPKAKSCTYGSCTVDGMGYYIGQCTSYVAWRRKTIGKPINPAIGNGGQWTGSRAGNYSQDGSPAYGDVMVFPYVPGYGHVAFVESVNPNGTVNISEYNWASPDTYSTRTVNPASYSAFFIH